MPSSHFFSFSSGGGGINGTDCFSPDLFLFGFFSVGGGGGGSSFFDGGIGGRDGTLFDFPLGTDVVPEVTADATLVDPRKFSPANEEATDSFTDSISLDRFMNSDGGVSSTKFIPSSSTFGREPDFEAARAATSKVGTSVADTDPGWRSAIVSLDSSMN